LHVDKDPFTSKTSIFESIIIVSCMLVSLLVALKLSKYITNRIFDPLRTLNFKLKNIISDSLKRDLINQGKSSLEILQLYDTFQFIIKTKKFENNDF
jgi:signal transduction histidine kinase